MIDGIEYKKILKNLPFGYALHKIELDNNGFPIDYEYIDVNESFEKFTGLKKENVLGKKITEILPNIKNSEFDWIKYYGDIAINGSENEFEQYSE
ncbi:PAS domain S-box protein, partial [Parabacteroides distasonis]